ncbi:unnamed protein product [Toxocara canis]|uniref:RNA-dependent RNA polymerase n=1 Tax=Toxocara canis TaxID=6265 RepID=A0A183VBG0_TOXCA|nr:unnamed protein product [Toxocara canis]
MRVNFQTFLAVPSPVPIASQTDTTKPAENLFPHCKSEGIPQLKIAKLTQMCRTAVTELQNSLRCAALQLQTVRKGKQEGKQQYTLAPGDECENQEEYSDLTNIEPHYCSFGIRYAPLNLAIGWERREAKSKSSMDQHCSNAHIELCLSYGSYIGTTTEDPHYPVDQLDGAPSLQPHNTALSTKYASNNQGR